MNYPALILSVCLLVAWICWWSQWRLYQLAKPDYRAMNALRAATVEGVMQKNWGFIAWNRSGSMFRAADPARAVQLAADNQELG